MKGFSRFFLFFVLISATLLTIFIYAEYNEEYAASNEGTVSAVQEKTWAGDINCAINDQKITGKWQLTANGSNIEGNVTVDEIGKGKLYGTIENDTLNAYVVYSILGQEKTFEWSGRVTEKNINGSSRIVIIDKIGDCVWGGDRVLKPKYAAIKREVGGREINITYAPVCIENCTKIVLVQVVCRKATFADGSESPINASDINPNWAEKDKSTVDGGKLCTVDYIIGEKDPYYNGDDAQDGTTQGKHAGSLNATMSDEPRYADEVVDNLTKKFGKEPAKVTLEFEVCAFCAEGPDAGTYYSCFRWNYEKTKGSDGASSDQGGDSSEPSKKFKEAAEQWSKEHGFPLPK